MRFPLLDLANELIVVILEHVDDPKELRAVALTCRHLQNLAEPLLYRSIFHTTGRQIVRLKEAITARKQRSHAIQIIESRCKLRQIGNLQELASIIANSKNLTDLTIESPFCNYAYGSKKTEWQRTMFDLLYPVYAMKAALDCSGPSLTRLTNLTLHLSQENQRYWDVTVEHSAIFAHPMLRSLTISCATIGDDLAESIRDLPNTPLTDLEIIECHINLQAFSSIMRLPRALKRLHIGQNCYHQSMIPSNHIGAVGARADQLCGRNPQAFFKALENQQASLDDLTYVVRGSSKTNVVLPFECEGFAHLVKLRHVTLDGHCPYFKRAFVLDKMAPPNLLCLKARGDMFRLPKPGLEPREDYKSQVDWMIAASTSIETLESVQIVSSQTFTTLKQSERDALVHLGEVFQSSKTRMEILRRCSHHAIPPFLHGEKADTEELVYTSNGQVFAIGFGQSPGGNSSVGCSDNSVRIFQPYGQRRDNSK